MPEGEEIALDSRKREHIDNEQCFCFTLKDKKECEEYKIKYPEVMFVRNEPTPIYNCHGLTFGGRRTTIWQREAVKQILDEDNYNEISRSEVKPGDVMMYIEPESGDYVHSGVVVHEIQAILGANDSGRQLVIVSKWGKYKEVMHTETYCPYSPVGAKFYRVKG